VGDLFVQAAARGVHEDCYADRFDGEGVLCTIIDDQHPDDGSSHYGATEKTVRACLQDWRFEQTAKTRAYVDRAFSVPRRPTARMAGSYRTSRPVVTPRRLTASTSTRGPAYAWKSSLSANP
jgi:hypothetical protein